jgi:hypothetical protein
VTRRRGGFSAALMCRGHQELNGQVRFFVAFAARDPIRLCVACRKHRRERLILHAFAGNVRSLAFGT